jgi:methionyl aminopeptidase
VIELKTPGEIDAMIAAGIVVADALAAVKTEAVAGVPLTALDQVARDVLADAGASSPFLGYRPGFAGTPFPAVICTSVNDAVLHGIPDGYRLRDGDLLSIDFGAVLNGWAADAATSFSVGEQRRADQKLISTAEAALEAGIAAATPGARVGDISAAIGRVGRTGGYGINTDFGGHGVGHAMHESPSVPNEGRPGRGVRLQPGLVIAIEPWFLGGGHDEYRVDRDGWTLRSGDGSRGAHVEHTVAITPDGPRILTTQLNGLRPSPGSAHRGQRCARTPDQPTPHGRAPISPQCGPHSRPGIAPGRAKISPRRAAGR